MRYLPKFNEAFQTGMANKIIIKLARILSRKVKRELHVTEEPMAYKNEYGKFNGYPVGIENSKKLIRINFALLKSDEIVSVDFYATKLAFAKGKPTFTIDTLDENGASLNIVQIVDLITENLYSFTTDDIDEGEIKITERVNSEGRYKMLFDAWLKDHPESLMNLQTKRIADNYTDFLAADTTYNQEVNLANFTKMAKEYLFGRGLTNPTFRKKKKGSRERVIVDQAKADQLEDVLENMSWQDKFSALIKAVKGVAAGVIQALVCWGAPGSGKTQTILDALDKEKVDYHKFSGGVKNTDELFNILVKYSNNTLIVFDDFDGILKNSDNINILKAATENKPKREITWRGKVLNFTSGVIFISNLQKFDSALMSRALRVQIDLSNEQMLDKIEKTLKDFMPDTPIVIKRQAVDFIKEIQGGLASVDYREISKVIIAIQIDPKDWKKTALLFIKSGN